MTKWLLNKVRDAIVDSSTTIGSEPTHISFGTGTTGETEDDTELDTEYVRKVIERIDDTIDNKIVIYCTLDTSEGNTTIREFGLHDASSGGNMHLREVLPVAYTKTSSVEIRLILSVTLESV